MAAGARGGGEDNIICYNGIIIPDSLNADLSSQSYREA